MPIPSSTPLGPERAAATAAEISDRYAVEMRLADVVSTGSGLTGLVRAVTQLTGQAAYLIDVHGRMVSHATPDPAAPQHRPIPDLATLRHQVGEPGPGRWIPRHVEWPTGSGVTNGLLATVARADEQFAWLLVVESLKRLGPRDSFVVERVASHLAGEYVTQRRVARVSCTSRANITLQLLQGTAQEPELRLSAEYLGVDVDAPRIIVFLDGGDGPSPATTDPDRLADLVGDLLGRDVLALRAPSGATLAVEASEAGDGVLLLREVGAALVSSLAEIGDEVTVAGLSGIARPDQLRRAYRESRDVSRCLARFAAPGLRVVAADELGPARLFVAHGEVAAVTTYVRDVLGDLLDEDAASRELLHTLECFCHAGGSVRGSAQVLAVHENTVRQRLARIQRMTGLNVAGVATDELAAQTALLVLRLQGHPGVSPFGTPVNPPHAVAGADLTA
ncbi:MAG: putative CdaR family transcriptional regulator [Nocardioidaceae bacterium]|nr:putative CdaR family transcriptional regulator [Nocardioidaceae bacterium]